MGYGTRLAAASRPRQRGTPDPVAHLAGGRSYSILEPIWGKRNKYREVPLNVTARKVAPE